MSFKIYNAATVGGNICMSLPAGAMISLTTALEGVYTLWPRERQAAQGLGARFRHRQPQECARAGRAAAQHPSSRASALEKRFAFRRNSLTHLGRSAALIVGTRSQDRRAICCSPSRRRRRGRCSSSSTGCRRPARLRHAIESASPGRRLVRRRARLGRRTSATSPIITPSRSGRSSPRDEPHGQRQETFRRARARPVPQDVPARARLVRRQEGLRPGRLRRLHRLDRRRAVP